MIGPTPGMSDSQLARIRADQLTMLGTGFDGSLTVRDRAGKLWRLGQDGQLAEHQPRNAVRVSLADLDAD